ncbi:Protein of unknown function DUF58 [Gemmobacter megaterium]|uniref:DUF58 domain-containing protein n=1 Tax=Gemmobacter megaterium TaxID=1086013 RepID=A0A1N7QD07_9RHOB|nr:DUF58 domain-containing protein [Gemmobacter megaterium]GGE25373.1 hypothetical protein GCM10011345_34110 [Gemmobacter megaterium]SIT20666.1 Protein of unknown function DUF58 [Gemmobacter megaterium]
MTLPQPLRLRAEALGATLPPLLAEAQHLSATIILGEHGRKQAGMGDAFWQFRPAMPGDPLRRIDWRRSARGDLPYVRETEWQAAQSVVLWVDGARSMAYSGGQGRPAKSDRARVLALALAVLLLRGGERVGLSGSAVPPRSGRAQVERIAEGLLEEDAEYGAPEAIGLAPHGRAVFLSDFLGDLAQLESALGRAAESGVTGALVQVLDPAEEEFPFDGRTIFESMGGSLRHETLRAGELRSRYLDRLADRKDRVQTLARAAGWQYTCHHTGQGAQTALLWLYRAMERRR